MRLNVLYRGTTSFQNPLVDGWTHVHRQRPERLTASNPNLQPVRFPAPNQRRYSLNESGRFVDVNHPVRSVQKGDAAHSDQDLGTISEPMHSVDQVVAQFNKDHPGMTPIIKGNLTSGVFVAAKEDGTRFTTAAAAKFYVAGTNPDGTPIFGRPASASHIHSSMLVSSDNLQAYAFIRSVDHYLRGKDVSLGNLDLTKTGGALLVGHEDEGVLVGPNGLLLPGDFGEVYFGQLEIVPGRFTDPVMAAWGLATGMQFKLDQLRAGGLEFMHVGTSSIPMGSPKDAQIVNTSAYMKAIAHRLFKDFRPRNREDAMIMAQLAKHHGYRDFAHMRADVQSYSPWGNQAAHMSAGLPQFIDDETGQYKMGERVTRNLANLMASKLGAIVRLLTAGGPLLYDVAPVLEGQKIRDVRTFTQNLLGTAPFINTSLDSPQQMIASLAYFMTHGLADRPDRGLGIHTDKYGKITPAAHDTYRIRASQTGYDSGRVEMTIPSATAVMPRARAMTFIQIMVAIAIAAAAEGVEALTYLQGLTGLKADFLKGDKNNNAETVAKQFSLYGPNTTQVTELNQIWLLVLKAFDVYPVIEELKRLAYKSLVGIQLESGLEGLAARGQGTLGGAMLSHARTGAGLEGARRMAAYGEQERQFILTHDPGVVAAAVGGDAGFRYEF